MALELFAGAGLGVLFGELQKEICRAKKNFKIFKPKLEELEETLALLYPVIQEIEELNKRLNRPNHGGETIKLRTLLEDGIELVSKCSKIPIWKRGSYGGKLVELENKILKFHSVCLLGPMARDQKQNLLLSQVTTKMMFMYLNQQGYSNITMGLTDPSDLTRSSNITVSLSAFGESNTSGSSWQAIVFLQIKSMKESYLPELNKVYQKFATKLQLLEVEPFPNQIDSMMLKKLKTILEDLIAFLHVSEGQILPGFKEKIPSYEKRIIGVIARNSMQSGQLPPHHMQLASQLQSQLAQIQSHENQMNPQMQSTNLQSSVATMPQSSMASLQHNSIPSISGASTTQQNMINSMQPGANLDSSSLNSLQLVGASTLQQNSVNAPQQTNTNHLSSQGGDSVLQQNSNPLQAGSTMPQHQQLNNHRNSRYCRINGLNIFNSGNWFKGSR